MQDYLNIQPGPTICWPDWCLRLDDGRVWSTRLVGWADAEFVEAWKARHNMTAVPLCGQDPDWQYDPAQPDRVPPHNEAGLSYQLSFYGSPLGELGTVEERFASLRKVKNEILALTDFVALADCDLPEEAKAKVFAYRKALKDLTDQEGAPWDGGYSQTPWPVLDAASTMSGRDPVVQELMAELPPKRYDEQYDVNELMASPVFSARVQLKRLMGAARESRQWEA